VTAINLGNSCCSGFRSKWYAGISVLKVTKGGKNSNTEVKSSYERGVVKEVELLNVTTNCIYGFYLITNS